NQAKQEFVRVQEQAESRQKQGEAKVKDVEARVALSQAKFDRLSNELVHCEVFSPADGVVQYGGGEGGHFRDDDRIAAGVSVRKGQTLMYLPDTSQMLVTTRIHEADRHMVRPGLPCLIKVPAVPGSSFHGRLTKVSQYADSANRWMNPDLKEHTAEILMEPTDAPVSPGDTAEVTLLIGELRNVLAVPVISVFARGAKSFVFLKKGGKAKPIEIKTGQSNTTMVEITSGLSEGDRILRFAGDELTALLPKAEVVAPTVGMPPMRGAMPAARGTGGGRPEAGRTGAGRMGAGRPAGGRMGAGRPGGDQKNQAASGNGVGKGGPSGARPRGQSRRGGGSERKSGAGGSERKGGGG
ncbi:MAG: efflux RND transporter periplasmic adaptor subunit, partial [Planctomycetes bacterium]|nr:efflux RND transporter periplasmic adaptor subunit [Planctomycetota bacterium]